MGTKWPGRCVSSLRPRKQCWWHRRVAGSQKTVAAPRRPVSTTIWSSRLSRLRCNTCSPISAAALDRAIDTLKAGRPINRAQLLERHPDLADAVDTLEQLTGGAANPMHQPLPKCLRAYRIERELGAGSFA